MHTAKELHEQIRYWRNIANAGRGSSMTEALHKSCDVLDAYAALLASVEDKDGVVRRLLEGARIAESCDGDAEFYRQAATLIVSQRQEIERVKDLARLMANQLRHFAPNAESLARYDRSAHPKDAPSGTNADTVAALALDVINVRTP